MSAFKRDLLAAVPLSRSFCDLEVRASGEGRTILGIVVPFERTAEVSDGGPFYPEMFRQGAFAKSIAERGDRVKLLSQHNGRANPLGRAIVLREDTIGLYGEFQVSKTAAGDEALELARDGALDSFSVGFAPVKHTKVGKTVVRTEVHLREVSLVTFPAYEDARIAAVRSMLESSMTTEEVIRFVASLDSSTTPLEPAELGTPVGAALSEESPSRHSARAIAWKNFQASLIEKGII